MNRTPIDVIVSPPPQCVVVVGEFDGVHLRHRRMIAMAQVRADRLGAPMFAIVLDTDSPWPQLSIPRRRCELLVSCGVSRAHLISGAGSDELTDTVQRLGPAELLIDSESLTPPGLTRFVEFLERANIPHSEPSAPDDDISTINSRTIVEHVRAGDVETAARMIGRSFELAGVIELGAALCQSTSVRSIQLRPDNRLVALPPGIYAGTIHSPRGRIAAVASVGLGVHRTVRGRVGTDAIDVHTIEAFDALSDGELSIDVLARLGDPYPVSGSADAVQRIDADVRRTYQLLGSARSNRDRAPQKNAESGSMP